MGAWPLVAGLLIALLGGCAQTPAPEPEPISPAAPADDTQALERLERRVEEGHFLDAALGYSKLASSVASPRRERYALRAAELLKDGNYVPQSFQLLREIEGADLGAEFQIRRGLLAADIALARQRPEEALSALDSVAPLLNEDEAEFRRRFHRLRAGAFAQSGNWLENARQLVWLEPLLSDPLAVQKNQTAILTALQHLTPAALETLTVSAPPDTLRGWLALARLGQSAEDAEHGREAITLWQAHYPNHPATEETIAALLAAQPQALRQPAQIALILPLDGRYAKAAAAVRDGFLAAYYQQARHTRDGDDGSATPRLRFYEEGDKPEQIGALYQQAVDDGAEFVVGPLNKAAVNHLAALADLPVPVLALNASEAHQGQPANLFELSLAPEQEARQVAERAWLDGHSRAAVIAPATPWGDRVAKAFNQRWLQLGGQVVEMQHYDPKKNDYARPIQRLLNVDESEARRHAVQTTLGKKLEFIPRRRQDIDFIFMAAFSRQARVIRPQLRFHYAAKVPVYATSHVFSGSVDTQMDRDMDGVLFADMPWTLHTDAAASALKGEIAQAWPNATKRYARLQALGVDAYRVIGHLNALRHDRTERFPGETGDLSLDATNRLQRRLLWARFQRGVPQLLDTFATPNEAAGVPYGSPQ